MAIKIWLISDAFFFVQILVHTNHKTLAKEIFTFAKVKDKANRFFLISSPAHTFNPVSMSYDRFLKGPNYIISYKLLKTHH